MEGCTRGYMRGCMDVCMGWIHQCIDAWMHGHEIDACMHACTMDGWMDGWSPGHKIKTIPLNSC